MDQVKIGNFLKKLRKERGLTQEALVQEIGVTDRSVSRWENGSTLPDISLLIWLADFYQVDIKELINGERKLVQVNQGEYKETLNQVAEYNNIVQTKRYNRFFRLYLIAFGVIILTLVIALSGMKTKTPELADFASGMAIGLSLVSVIVGLLFTSNRLESVVKWKERQLFGRK